MLSLPGLCFCSEAISSHDNQTWLRRHEKLLRLRPAPFPDVPSNAPHRETLDWRLLWILFLMQRLEGGNVCPRTFPFPPSDQVLDLIWPCTQARWQGILRRLSCQICSAAKPNLAGPRQLLVGNCRKRRGLVRTSAWREGRGHVRTSALKQPWPASPR